MWGGDGGGCRWAGRVFYTERGVCYNGSMSKRRGNRGKKIFGGLIGVVVMAVAVCLGVQFATGTGLFRVPGVVYYDESLNEAEVAVLKRIFTEEIDLDKDVTISAREEMTLPTLGEGEFLCEIMVPVTDFYSAETGVTVADVAELVAGSGRIAGASGNATEMAGQEAETGTAGEMGSLKYELIPVSELDYRRKLLRVNDEYYLDAFASGAVFRVISFESELYAEEIAPLVEETMLAREFPQASEVLTLAQTGVTALSRRMNTKLAQVGNGAYFAEKIGPWLASFDLTHTSNESSFSGAASSSNICSDARFIDTLTAIGLDIVELTGNHNQDCGDQAAIKTIDIYNENGIRTVGGGKTAAEAAVPLEISEKSNRITMLGFNQSTGGATYDNTPGANQYYEEVAREQIGAAKARGDLVIVDVQYYECNEYDVTYESTACDYANSAAGDQVGLFRSLIDMGADIVVGTSAHQPQTFELYGGGVIYYGLGNLFFDQVWWPGTTRSLVLVHHIYQDRLLQTEIVPTVYDASYQTELMDEETAKWYLERLASARP